LWEKFPVWSTGNIFYYSTKKGGGAMTFNDSITFEITNIKGLEEASKLAPKRILSTLKREYAREGAKFKTEFRKNNLFGPPGINLPRRAVGFTLKSKKKTFTKIKTKRARGRNCPMS